MGAGDVFRAMSSVLRFKKGRGAPQADPPVDETTRDVLPPPEPALLDWATLTQPPDDSHLAPCPQCGAPNGLSAASCWSCETNLLALEPFRRRREHGPAHVDESIPVLTSALEDNDPTAEHPTVAVSASAPVPLPMPETGGRRHRWAMGGSILVVAVVAVGAFLYVDAPAPPGAAKSGGSVDAPAPVALTTAPPAPTAPAAPIEPAAVSKASPASPETRTAALRALAVDPQPPTAAQAPPTAAPAATPIDVAIPPSTTPPAGTATLKAAHGGKARRASRSQNVATELAVPPPARPESPRQAPFPARPCTATVAALGLCAAPIESKE